MKSISLPHIRHFHVDVVSGTEWSTAGVDEVEFDQARAQGMRIVESALHIEKLINQILCMTIFRELKLDMAFVSNQLLESDKLQIVHKRDLLKTALRRDELLDPKGIQELDKNLREVFVYRNAFAHGNIIIKNKIIVLRYYVSGHQEVELDEGFWQKVEDRFRGSFDALMGILEKGKKLYRPEPPLTPINS